MIGNPKRPPNFTIQLFHDNAPYGTPVEETANEFGETYKSATVECLEGHWETDVDVENGTSGHAEYDCKPPNEECNPGGVVTAAAGLSADAPSCSPSWWPFPWPEPIGDPFPFPWPEPIPVPIPAFAFLLGCEALTL